MGKKYRRVDDTGVKEDIIPESTPRPRSARTIIVFRWLGGRENFSLTESGPSNNDDEICVLLLWEKLLSRVEECSNRLVV